MFEPRRNLGNTGFVASILGIGDLADRRIPIEISVKTIRRALEAGLNVIDTAPNYEDGLSEQIVGRAVRGYRDRTFVIDKIDRHDEAVGPQIDASLKRLQFDHVDTFVFHDLSSLETFGRLCQPLGGFEQLAIAVQQGKCRFRGISSHNPDVLRAALTTGICDIVMFPVGPLVDSRYINEILPMAKRIGVGTVCFKTFAAGKLLGDTSGYSQPLRDRPRGKTSSGGSNDVSPNLPRLSVEECLHYTLTLDPDVALLGMSFPNEQDLAFDAARSFRPLSNDRMADIRNRAMAAAQEKGPCWWNPPDAPAISTELPNP